MYQVMTASELRNKGITKRHIADMLARAEKLCNWHAKRHMLHGTADAQQAEWDAACAKWDHLKATLAGFSRAA